MIKNIIFFLLLLFGMNLSILNIQVGIIYNFCLIFIFNKYFNLNYIEPFKTCLYNTPSYQISLTPLIIDLGTIDKCSDTNSNFQEISIDSSLNQINFTLEIPELITKFKINDSINISGTSLSPTFSYTIKYISLDQIVLNEKILKNEIIKEGKIIIKLASNLNPNKNFIIYKYDDLNNSVSNVDNYIVSNKKNLTEIKTYQDLIKKTNQTIANNNEKIKINENLIKNNNNINNSYELDIQDKFLLTDKYKELIDNQADISNNQLSEINEEIYDKFDEKLLNINNNLSINEKYKLDIINLRKENEKLNSLKCTYITKIKSLITKINNNYQTIDLNNSDIYTQNINYNVFFDKCNKIYDLNNSLSSSSNNECPS